jgi:hypothetical protein
MRKRLIAALTVVAVLSFGGVAFAENIYEVHIANSSPKGKGTPSKPLPVKLGFGYTVGDTEGLRPTVLEQYRIAPEGLVTFPKLFPSCRFTQVDDNVPYSTLPSKCRGQAVVGSGLVKNNAGAVGDRTQKLICNLKLTLINLSDAGRNGGMAIRLDGDPPAAPPGSNAVGCTLPVHTAIKAPFFNVKLEGLKTAELRFTVPLNLQEPLSGVQNAVVEATSTVKRRTASTRIRGKRRTVGFYSEIGCKGRTRTTRVTFVDTERRSFTANRKSPC